MKALRITTTAIVGSLFFLTILIQPTLAKSPPLGFLMMCLSHPEECQSSGAVSVEITDGVLGTIKRVNLSVNHRIRPLADQGNDVWSINATSGDCEEYVLAKRHDLIRSGIPSAALRIAAVKTRSGEGHAILIVNTSRGKFVLDNRTTAIRPLGQTGYRVVSLQSADPYQWN